MLTRTHNPFILGCITALCLSCAGANSPLVNGKQSTATLTYPVVKEQEPPIGETFYVSRDGKPDGKGSKKHPWDLATALSLSTKIKPGATIYLRGGAYRGKFQCHLTGDSSKPITVRSYPGEWAKLDGYMTTTLSGAISSSMTSITLVDGASFADGNVFTFRDGEVGTEEQVYLNGKSGNTFSSCSRGWNGTKPINHSSGVTMVLGGSQVNVDGSYMIWRDLEITNSNPLRTQDTPNSQDAPYLRGEGVFNLGAHNKFINCIIHDVQDGYFNGDTGVGAEIYGCLIFNNGYVAGGRYNGHGLYLIHTDLNSTAYIKDNVVFNNSNMGIKGDSQTGNTVNIWSEGNICFNNGSWTNDVTRHFNLFMATNNGIADAITVKDNYLWHPIGVNGGSFVMGIGGVDMGSLIATGNYVMGGGQAVAIDRWTAVTFTGNSVDASDASPGNAQLIAYSPSSGGTTAIWNNNVYYNNTPNKKGFFSGNSDALDLTEWNSKTGFDSTSTYVIGHPTSSVVAVRANRYDSSQANIVIYNWSNAKKIRVDLSSILSQGDRYLIYAVEDIFGSAVASGTYKGGQVKIKIKGGSVTQPVGWGTSITSVRPAFAVYRLWKGSRPL